MKNWATDQPKSSGPWEESFTYIYPAVRSHCFFFCLPFLLLCNSLDFDEYMQLPLSLLRAATGTGGEEDDDAAAGGGGGGSPLLVELKDGDTYNGRLKSVDAYMNMHLVGVICTSSGGDRFWKLPSAYIRGSAIKYLRLPPTLVEDAAEAIKPESSFPRAALRTTSIDRSRSARAGSTCGTFRRRSLETSLS